jgi:hydrophobe/amphiphile efflux-1 (HAE1) family protein
VATSLLAAALLLAGLLAYFHLPVAPLPRVDFPTIQVSASLPGASPETMASAVATPLERRFGRIAGLTEMTSTSSLGSTSITLQFDLDRNVDGAARDVQAAIAAAGGELPPDLPLKPRYRKVNPADSPTLILALWSDTLPLVKVFDVANNIIAQKISQVKGVGEVFVGGGQQPAVRVELDPPALAGMGLAMSDVRKAIAATTTDQAKGNIGGKLQATTIGANDQLFDARGYSLIRITTPNGTTSKLGDLARVYDDVENNRVAGWADGKRAVLLIVRKQSDANVLEVNKRVLTLLPELMAAVSPAIHLDVNSDRTDTIKASVDDVEITLGISMVLVVVVVFGFLRSARATLVPTVAMPLSLVATFGVMWLMRYSIDNLSLMALTISTGFVVDDAIVVTENIARGIENGEPPIQAALDGAKQIGFTIVSITLSLLAVFVPLLLMGGIVGRLFREFAVTLGIAVAVSAVVSLTLTPMMCARLLRPEHNVEHGWAYRTSERFFDGLRAVYERALRWALAHRATMLLITLFTVALNVYLMAKVPKGLFPQQDTGMLIVSTEAAQDVSYAEMERLQIAVDNVLDHDPDVGHYVTFIGSGGFGTGNTGRGFITLNPLGQRKATADQVLARLRGKFSKIPGINTYLQSRQEVNVGGRAARTQYQYTVQTASLEELRIWSARLTDAMKKLPQLKDVVSDQQNAGLELDIDVDRDTASALGVTAQAVDEALYDTYGQRFVATNYTEQNEYHVVMEAKPSRRDTPNSLDDVYVRSTNGNLVPLSAIAKTRQGMTALAVNHNGQFPSVTISFNLAAGASLGQAVDAIGKAELAIHLPPSIIADFQGTAQAFTSSLKNEPYLILAALIAVYLVLGVLYESYLHPVTILSTLPSAGVGALVALLVFHVDLDVIAMVGLLLLIGIVKKNAILLIDFAIEARRNEHLTPEAAMLEAGVLRFRPILMTTCAALFGALPLAFGSGLGSELRRPLGIAIAGGLVASQLLTLFTTPVVYLALERLKERLRPRSRATPTPPPAAAEPPALPAE